MTNTYIPNYGAYSFMDVRAVLSGPGTSYLNIGGPIPVAGPNSASAEEGVTITLGEETNTQTIGADGAVMNSLHASRAGTATFRLLKTSPVNKALMLVYNYQRQQSSLWARNTITVEDIARGDKYNLQGCAFVRFPTNSYAKVGNTLEWEFHVSLCDILLGNEASMTGGAGGFWGDWALGGAPSPALLAQQHLQAGPPHVALGMRMRALAGSRAYDELSPQGRGGS